jgi:hypothetical protein
VIDSEDLSQGFVLKRILGTRRTSLEGNEDLVVEDEVLASQEAGMADGPRPVVASSTQGLSISADDTLERHHAKSAFGISDSDASEDEDDDDSSSAHSEGHGPSSETPLIRNIAP